MEQEKLYYGESRNNNKVECDDIYYLFIGKAGYLVDDCNHRPLYFNDLKAQKAYFGADSNYLKDKEFVGIAKKDEEVALVQLWYRGENFEPMRVRPEDARDASVRKEWLDDAIEHLEWVKDRGDDFGVIRFNGLDPETVNTNEIQVHTRVYKIGERCKLIEEYWTDDFVDED